MVKKSIKSIILLLLIAVAIEMVVINIPVIKQVLDLEQGMKRDPTLLSFQTSESITTPAGFVDNLHMISNGSQGDTINISGWAIDPQHGVPAKGILILANGQPLPYLFSITTDRPDVVKALNNRGILQCGWDIHLPGSIIGTGKHQLSFYAVLGNQQFAPLQLGNGIDGAVSINKTTGKGWYYIAEFAIIFLLLFIIWFIMKKGFAQVLDITTKYRFLIALFLFVFLVIAKLNGSSIGIWSDTLSTHNSVILGEDRGIRSDEWLVHTPWMLSQQFDNYATLNPNIRSEGQNMLLTNVPTLDISLITKPYFWGFLLFGGGYGLSWYWASKILLLLLLSYEIAMYLSGGHKLLSVFAALWIGLSPPVQWWFDTSTPYVEILIYAQGMIVSAIYFLKYPQKPIRRILFMVLMTVCVMGYVSELVPEFQVPLGYLTLIFLGSFIYPHIKGRTLFLGKKEKFAALLCMTSIMLYLGWFIYTAFDPMKVLLHTVYPGSRISLGGQYNPKWLQLFLIGWMLPFKDVPVTLFNNSEASQYINFLPALMLTFFLSYKRDCDPERNMLVKGLFAYLIIQLLWLFVKFPQPIAKLILFSYVPERRFANVVVGLTITYLTIWIIPILGKSKPLNMLMALCASFCIGVIYFFSVFDTPMAQYLTPIGSWLIIVYFVIANYFLLRGHTKIFLSILLPIIIISGALVNPINHGIDAMTNGELLGQIRQIEAKDPQTKWATDDSLVLGQLLVANGVRVFNSVQYYPDLPMWHSLDPNKHYEDIYNRYAHVMLDLTDKSTSFKIIGADVFEVYLDVSDLNKAGIKYILSQKDLSQFGSILKEVFREPNKNFYIYKVTSSVAS